MCAYMLYLGDCSVSTVAIGIVISVFSWDSGESQSNVVENHFCGVLEELSLMVWNLVQREGMSVFSTGKPNFTLDLDWKCFFIWPSGL